MATWIGWIYSSANLCSSHHFENCDTATKYDTASPVNDKLPANCFEAIAAGYLSSGRGSVGIVGVAPSNLLDGPDLVKFGTGWLEDFVKPEPKR